MLNRPCRALPGIPATVLAVILIVLGVPTLARADESADIDRLMKSAQYPAALVKADAFLSRKPRDAQMRFTKGVILTELNRQQDAIVIFTRLTEDYPNLPEPFNNLAVLYAAQGQYEKARSALDKAIRTNPSYATAYENLGDIHAKLASLAYGRALQLDSGNTNAKSKLTLVRNLALAGTAPMQLADKQPAQKPANAIPAKPPSPPVVAAAPIAPPIGAQKVPPAPLASPPAPRVDVAPAAAPKVKPDPTPEAAPQQAARGDAERELVLAAVASWARAWSARDVKAYLTHYAPDFDPPGTQSRKAWADERDARIAGKGRISVRVESPQVKIENGRATVKFSQTYVSDRLSANSRKTLVLVKHRGKWLIQKESTGN